MRTTIYEKSSMLLWGALMPRAAERPSQGEDRHILHSLAVHNILLPTKKILKVRCSEAVSQSLLCYLIRGTACQWWNYSIFCSSRHAALLPICGFNTLQKKSQRNNKSCTHIFTYWFPLHVPWKTRSILLEIRPFSVVVKLYNTRFMDPSFCIKWKNIMVLHAGSSFTDSNQMQHISSHWCF